MPPDRRRRSMDTGRRFCSSGRPRGRRHLLLLLLLLESVLEMLRRFLLVGLMSILPTPNDVGSVVQLSIATLFSIFFLMLQLQVRHSQLF